MICDSGDIVVVPFPFVDIPASKRRPSAILSARHFNEANGHSLCAMITTAAGSRWPSDYAISDLKSAGLPRACVLRWKLFTLPNDLILKKAGVLTAADRSEIVRIAQKIMS